MGRVIKAIIPVRAGSQRVKNKNIRQFANSNLLEIKIKQLQKINELDEIIVNTDSDEMIEIAKSLNVSTFKRDKYYATNEISINKVYKNIAENTQADDIFYAHVTSPLLKTDTIKKAIKLYLENPKEYDSICSVTPVKEFLWQNNKPINYDEYNKPRSQDLPEIFSLNNAISIIPRKIMIEKEDIVGYRPYFYIMDKYESIDIDNEIDFEFAEFLYKKYATGDK